MKYRVLLLVMLLCAVLVAAMGGTLAGYTNEAAFSFSITPNVHAVRTQRADVPPYAAITGQDAQAESEVQETPVAAPDLMPTLQENE